MFLWVAVTGYGGMGMRVLVHDIHDSEHLIHLSEKGRHKGVALFWRQFQIFQKDPDGFS